MSKQAPFFDAGDGKTWHPVKVVFEGVDPKSPQAHELAKAFAPALKSFYLGAARSHALGSNDQSRSHRQFGDGLSMSYTNQFGLETVVVRGAGVSAAQSHRASASGLRPDWLYVEFRTPNAGGFTPTIAAFPKIPAEGDLMRLTGLGLPTAAYYTATTTGDVQYGWAADGLGDLPIEEIARNSDDKRCYVVDLRRLRGYPVVIIDFYGVMSRYGSDVEFSVHDYEWDYNGRVTEENIEELIWQDLVEFDSSPTTGWYVWESQRYPTGFEKLSGYVTQIQAEIARWQADYDHPSILDVPETKSTPEPFVYYFGDYDYQFVLTQVLSDRWTRDWRFSAGRTTVPYNPRHTPEFVGTRPTEVRGRLLGSTAWARRRKQHYEILPWGVSMAPGYGTTYNAYPQDFVMWVHADGREVESAKLADIQLYTYNPFEENPVGFDPNTHFDMPFLGSITVIQDAWSLSWGR